MTITPSFFLSPPDAPFPPILGLVRLLLVADPSHLPGPTSIPQAAPGCSGAPASVRLQEKGKLVWEEAPRELAVAPGNNGPQN